MQYYEASILKPRILSATGEKGIWQNFKKFHHQWTEASLSSQCSLSKILFFDEKDKLIQTLKEKVQKLQVQNNEKDLIIKSQEEEIRRLKEEVDSLIKKTTFEWKSSSLSEPPLTMTITNTKFDEDSDDMVPKL